MNTQIVNVAERDTGRKAHARQDTQVTGWHCPWPGRSRLAASHSIAPPSPGSVGAAPLPEAVTAGLPSGGSPNSKSFGRKARWL